ncbi:MAG: flagellar protein FlgN [Chitinophagales bacterium]
MTEEIQALLRLLDEEAVRYTALLEMARRKADLLSSRGSVTEIQALAGREARFVEEVVGLERERVSLMRRIASAFEGKLPQLTVSALCDRLPGDLSTQLSRAAASITATLTELKTVNRLNAALLKQELSLISFSFDLLTNAGARATYSNPAVAQPANPRLSALLDARA